jgi:hypothetical protein
MIPTRVRITIIMSKMFQGSMKNLTLYPISFIVNSRVNMTVSVRFKLSNDYDSFTGIPYHYIERITVLSTRHKFIKF